MFLSRVRLACVAFSTLSAISLRAQPANSNNPPILAGAGYTLALPSIPAAPGQLLLLSVYGVKQLPDGPQLATTFPTYSLNGVSVDLVQGLLPDQPNAPQPPTTTTPIEIRAVQQSFCAISESCTTITGITLQIPFSLGPFTGSFPVLRVKQNGQVVGSVMIRPVSDNIHVLNTCDATLNFISAASGIPANICAPAALVRGSINSLYNLLKAGDAVSVWAYGLGAIANDTSGPDSRLQQSFRLNYEFRPNAPAAPPANPANLTTPLFAGYVGGGEYQVNFTIPPVPAGTPACDGVTIKSNLTITLSGPASYDAIPLCVAP